MLRVFRHYLWVSSIILASSEAGLLFAVLILLNRMVGAQAFGIAPDEAPGPALLMTVAALVGMSSVGLYNREHAVDLGQVVSRALVVLPLVLLGVGGVVLVLHLVFPESTRLGFLVLAAAGLTLFFPVLVGLRGSFVHALDHYDVLRRRVLVMGQGAHAARIQRLSLAGRGRAFTVVGALGELPAADELVAQCNAQRIDEVVVTEATRDLALQQLLACKLAGVEITPYLDFWERETGQVDLDVITPHWLVFCDGFRSGKLRAFVKRAFDIGLASLLLVLSLPITLPTALLIRLESPGPIFYRQERVGWRGRSFHILKFRSMRQDAERDGPQWAAKNDARVTRVGAFIRKVRIDEIPQAINVLKGEMSFIGPRPERPVFVEALRETIAWYDERHAVKPGITGWAQINYPYGATAQDAKNKLAYDLYYVKNASLFLDLIIFLQTVKVLLWNEGAR